MKRGLAIGLVIGMLLSASVSWAQDQQPQQYFIGTFGDWWGKANVYRFETGDTECYVTHLGGISCLRKVQP